VTSPDAPPRIYLSPPHVGEAERALLIDAIDSNWIAPLGPHVDAFERETAAVCGRTAGAATNSGTAALHLALRLVGVGAGSEVVLPTLTFVATANSALYLGATPVLVDVSPDTWTLDPALVASQLAERSRLGRLPAAVIAVDLYGQCADYDALTAICAEYDVPLVVDAAESLGATYRGRPAASAGVLSILSFNGNKIITTSGGGMLLADDEKAAARARMLAAQAREPVAHYEHRELGYNYRLSNLLAALGRGQLASLPGKIARRQEVNAFYQKSFGGFPGVGFMPDAAYGTSTNWLTCMTLDEHARATPATVQAALEEANIEARPAWKPLHLQPLFADTTRIGGVVAAGIFARGLCLPSGSSLTDENLERISDVVAPLLG
jgi:dTDP-4-amino-4,6-dideoxygalactose transaminase